MSWNGIQIGLIVGVIIPILTAHEQVLQVNVNKPVNDVSEKFVSFSIQPETLVEVLSGPNRDIVAAMAKKLGPSNLKINGHFDFMSSLIGNDLMTHEKAVGVNTKSTVEAWNMLNQFTRAMDWQMVIPVPYSPNNWDPATALDILNVSSAIGIEDCIWQLGLDFGSTRALTYASDLSTLHLIVNAFTNYVRSWKVVGADITAGSNPEQTRMYVDLSKDLTEAVGWTQPPDYHVEEQINGYIYEKDFALRTILNKDIPAWLTLPQKIHPFPQMKAFANVQLSEGLQWSQTLGHAARFGFDVVYKPMDKEDMTSPSLAYYVTLFFKRLMGTKVFDAKIMSSDSFTSRLYSHCANEKSGGIAFMGVNTEESDMQMIVKTSVKFTGSEIWQYVLNMKDGQIHLNGAPLTLESNYEPFVKIKHPNLPFTLNLPAMSVGFWILPLANHVECLIPSGGRQKIAKKTRPSLSRTDKLLQKLIADNSLAAKRNQYAAPEAVGRQKRFILANDPNPFVDLFEKSEKTLQKRENSNQWFNRVLFQDFFLPKSKRSRRSVNDFLGSLFGREAGQQSRFLDAPSFDEENLFRLFHHPNGGSPPIPSGDIHLEMVSNGDDDEGGKDTQQKRSLLKNFLKSSYSHVESDSAPRNRLDSSSEMDNYFKEKLITDITTIDDNAYKSPAGMRIDDGAKFHERQRQLMSSMYANEAPSARLDVFGTGPSGDRPLGIVRRLHDQRDEESNFKPFRKTKQWWESKRSRRSIFGDERDNMILKDSEEELSSLDKDEEIKKVISSSIPDFLGIFASHVTNAMNIFNRRVTDLWNMFAL